MSDSDDTDYLLLIPPNFFWVPSDDEEKGVETLASVDRELVDGLLSHVNCLESRVTAIESFENSLAADLEIITSFSSPRSVNFLPSFKSNYQQVLDWVSSSEFGRSNDPSSNNNLRDSTLLTNKPESRYSPRLRSKEIALTDMTSPVKNFGADPIMHRQDSRKRIELTEVDRLLKEMESTQRDIENRLHIREKEYGLSGEGDADRLNLEKTRPPALLGDDINSVPDLGLGVRNMFVSSPQSRSVKPYQPDPKPVVEDPCTKRSISLLGSKNEESDKWKTYFSHDYNTGTQMELSKSPEKNNGLHSVRRKLPLTNLESVQRNESLVYSEKLATPLKSLASSPLKPESRHSERFGSATKLSAPAPSQVSVSGRTAYSGVDKAAGDNATDMSEEASLSQRTRLMASNLPVVSEKLLSLNELWKEEDDTGMRNPVKLKQKLEEEKYRRLHLENMVQSLQKKVLEDQEKLAVAIQVDEKKDLVIEKVTEAWKRMVDHWKQIEDQRHQASQALLTERAVAKRSQEEINKRVVRWEREVSQALDLAAGFKTKAEGLERELVSARGELVDKLRESEGRLADAELQVKQKDNDITLLHQRLDETHRQLLEERKATEETKVELGRLEGCSTRMEAELLVTKEQRDLLAMRLKEETSRTKLLEQQKNSLESSLSESLNKQKEAEEKYQSSNKHLETVKLELKALYQSQLESVVREKLAEFQAQLETARDDMRHQLDAELAAARESARRQQQALVNSHVAEMRRLESIHKEEMGSIERRLGEAESRCARLELAKRDVAHKLHKVMENQWQQALGIITGDLSFKQAESDRGQQGSLRTEDLSQMMEHESPCKEMPNSAPPSNQNQLLKYIELMLDKHPGRPVDTLDSSILQDSCDLLDDSGLNPQNWNTRLRPGGQESEKDVKKPPWK